MVGQAVGAQRAALWAAGGAEVGALQEGEGSDATGKGGRGTDGGHGASGNDTGGARGDVGTSFFFRPLCTSHGQKYVQSTMSLTQCRGLMGHASSARPARSAGRCWTAEGSSLLHDESSLRRKRGPRQPCQPGTALQHATEAQSRRRWRQIAPDAGGLRSPPEPAASPRPSPGGVHRDGDGDLHRERCEVEVQPEWSLSRRSIGHAGWRKRAAEASGKIVPARTERSRAQPVLLVNWRRRHAAEWRNPNCGPWAHLQGSRRASSRSSGVGTETQFPRRVWRPRVCGSMQPGPLRSTIISGYLCVGGVPPINLLSGVGATGFTAPQLICPVFRNGVCEVVLKKQAPNAPLSRSVAESHSVCLRMYFGAA